MTPNAIKDLLGLVSRAVKTKHPDYTELTLFNLKVRTRSGVEYLLDSLTNVDNGVLRGSVSTGQVNDGDELIIALDAIEAITWVATKNNPTPIRIYWGLAAR